MLRKKDRERERGRRERLREEIGKKLEKSKNRTGIVSIDREWREVDEK